MRILSDILLSLIELGEAELHSLRCGVRSLIAQGVMLMVAGLVAVFAVVMLVYAEYAAIALALGPPIAALLCGVTALVLAAIVWGVASWRNR